MKVQITDRESFAQIRPADVLTYVQSEGWTLQGYWAGRLASVWNKESFKLVVPQDSSLADYPNRLSEVITQLATIERRSQLEIYRDVATSSADVIRFRLVAAASSDGNLGLQEGVQLFEAAKEIFFSAARATVSPKAAFRSRLPHEADEYLKNVKLGQTERGSYVITVISPVAADFQASLIPGAVETTFDRRVTETLAVSLSSAWRATQIAMLNNDYSAFTNAVNVGVSANLCEALASLGENIPDSSTEIGFSWARNRERPAEPLTTLTIPSRAGPTLRQAAKFLKESLTDDNFELSGNVIRLEREQFLHGGEVLVLGELEPTVFAKVKLELSPQQYQMALEAHSVGSNISCTGKLRKDGRYWTLSEIRDLIVTPEE